MKMWSAVASLLLAPLGSFAQSPSVPEPLYGTRCHYAGTARRFSGEVVAYERFVTMIDPDPIGRAALRVMERYGDDWTPHTAFRHLFSGADLAEMLEQCARLGGAPEDVTIPAGTFRSCRLRRDGGETVWFGQVPFGLLKAVEETAPMTRIYALLSCEQRDDWPPGGRPR